VASAVWPARREVGAAPNCRGKKGKKGERGGKKGREPVRCYPPLHCPRVRPGEEKKGEKGAAPLWIQKKRGGEEEGGAESYFTYFLPLSSGRGRTEKKKVAVRAGRRK